MKGTAKIENAIVEIPYCIPEPPPEGRTMIQHVGIIGIVTFLVSAIVASFWLIGKGMNIKTVKRVFSSVRAIVNIAITEKGIECINGFAKTYFPEEVNASERKPISIEAIRHIQKLCRQEDDELRWLIA